MAADRPRSAGSDFGPVPPPRPTLVEIGGRDGFRARVEPSSPPATATVIRPARAALDINGSFQLETLETERLLLRHRRVEEAAAYRQLWAERDPRVPPHRRIDGEGRPTVEDIAAQIRAEREQSRPGLLAVERKWTSDVIGYCGLVFQGNGAPDEPELAFELLRAAHGCGYATEAGGAVVAWASEAGYGRVWATVRDWNAASRRVLEKLGFRETDHVEHDPIHGDSLLVEREFEP